MSCQESLVYFGDRRTDLDKGKTFQGVETPSQVGNQFYEKIYLLINRKYLQCIFGVFFEKVWIEEFKIDK